MKEWAEEKKHIEKTEKRQLGRGQTRRGDPPDRSQGKSFKKDRWSTRSNVPEKNTLTPIGFKNQKGEVGKCNFRGILGVK